MRWNSHLFDHNRIGDGNSLAEGLSPMKHALVVAVVVVLALSGCADSEKPAAPVSGSSSMTTASTEPAKLKTAEDVVNALKNGGLPIGETEVYDATTDPNHQIGRPNGYTSKANFSDTRFELVRDDDNNLTVLPVARRGLCRSRLSSGPCRVPRYGHQRHGCTDRVRLRARYDAAPNLQHRHARTGGRLRDGSKGQSRRMTCGAFQADLRRALSARICSWSKSDV